MNNERLPFPDFPSGVFDAGMYRAYTPGPAVLEKPSLSSLIPGNPRNILVVGLAASGDVLHFLPVAVALRRNFPSAGIGWVVQDKARSIVEGRADLAKVHVFERHRWHKGVLGLSTVFSTLNEILAFRKGIRESGYDMLFDPQGTAKSAMVNWLSGVEPRVGFSGSYCREFSNLSTTVRVVLPTRRMHRVRKSLALLEAVGLDVSEHAARFEVSPNVQGEADSELERAGIAGRAFAVIHPGTSEFGARKRWPLDRFSELADRVYGEFDLVPVLVFGPVEKAWKGELLAGVKSAPKVSIEPASLAHLGGILARSRCFIGADSAPLHLASNLRVPVVGLYGPTDPVLFAPYYPPGVVVVKGLKCGRCGAPHCNHPVPRMEAITVNEVALGVGKLMELTARGR